MTVPLTERTYRPEHARDISSVSNFLERHQQIRGEEVLPRYALVGGDERDRVELPKELHGVLVQVVEALLAGKAVTVTPRDLTMTTQQVADYLGVSRPTIVKLVDEGELAAERIGSRRRLKLADVDAYRARRRQEQYAALLADESPAQTDEDLDTALGRLADIRRRRAASRRPNTP